MSTHAAALAALLEEMRQTVENFYANLPQAEREAYGSWEKWAPKDFLAHMTYWQNSSLQVLNSLTQEPPSQPEFEERNHQNFLATHEKPWSEIHAAYHQSLDAICARLESLSDGDLTEPGCFPRLGSETSLEANLLGNCYTHNAAHLAELLTKRGNSAGALQLQEAATQKLIDLDPSPRNRGTALYNLGCAYALQGDVTRTVELLRQAFSLRDDLLEFSKQDTDFDQIRSNAKFQALYG